MRYNPLQKAVEYNKNHRRRRRWQQVVSVMASIVVFCTTYALILPAITMEDLTCTVTEHIHGPECYSEVTEFVCMAEEGEGHQHDDRCFTEVDRLVCMADKAEAHHHDGECYGEDGALICALQETDGHKHEGSCYVKERVLTCELPEAPAHYHSDEECYAVGQVLTCGISEHTHDKEKCYAHDAEPEPDEDIVEGEPVANEYFCGYAEHIEHSEDCYDAEGALVCELELHAHDESCAVEPEIEVEVEEEPAENFMVLLPQGEKIPEGYEADPYTYTDNATFGVTVYHDGTAFPEGAEVYLKADQLLAESEDEAIAEAYAQAEQTLLDEAVEYDGMLAFDIRFEDADGEEVEPAAPVYVVINAKGLIPADADAETVAVQHHSEIEKKLLSIIPVGTEIEMDIVADMSEETGTIAAVVEADNEGLMDLATMFEVEGFSTFTVTWVEDSRNRVTVHYVNESGHEINGKTTENVVLDLNEPLDLTAAGPYSQANGTYVYKEARLDAATGEIITSIRLNERSEWIYTDASGNEKEWAVGTVRNIYIVFQLTSAEYIETIDTTNINISLFNYDTGMDNNRTEYKVNRIGGTSTGTPRPFQFLFKDTNGINGYDEDEQTGIVRSKLVDGYPVLAKGDSAGTSLRYLFDKNHEENKQITNGNAYTNLTGLFKYDASTGGYTYDSDVNFARLNDSHTHIDVYKNKGAAVASSWYAGAYFAPFNNITDKGTRSGANYRSIDYHFAMTIDFEFIMPEGGKINDEDMIFEFSGDDDVWVFVDDVLVLDLGGIHEAVDGSINFATGAISGGSGGNLWTILANNQVGNGQKFTDYSKHTFKFFYLERGAGGSNCKISFNIPSIPSNSVNVGKKLSNTTATTNQEYSFRVLRSFTEQNPVGELLESTVDGDKTIGANVAYDIYNLSDWRKIGEGTTDENGIIKVRPGQVAVFPDAFKSDDTPEQYYVQELIPVSYDSLYQDVEINNMSDSIYEAGEITIGGQQYKGYIAGVNEGKELTTDEDNTVVFINSLSQEEEDKSYLAVEKIVRHATAEFLNKEYEVHVTLDGTPVARGTTYSVYAYDGNGALNLVNERQTVTSNNGTITLRNGYQARFEAMAGTDYLVWETDYEDNLETYQVTTKVSGTGTTESANAVHGVVPTTGEVVTVTVYNSPVTGYLKIGKQVVNTYDPSAVVGNFTFHVELPNDIKTEELAITYSPTKVDDSSILTIDSKKYLVITLEHNQVALISGLPLQQYTVSEQNTDGYSVSWTGDSAEAANQVHSAMVTTKLIESDPDYAVSVTCINTTGYELPSTGGIGTMIYTISGSVVMGAAALVGGISLKRRRERGQDE